jgi:hypothetical protein
MRARRHRLRDLGQMQRHGLGRAARQHQPRSLAVRRADGPEDVSRRSPQIAGRRWARAAFGPAAGDLVLLADACLIGKPDLYGLGASLLMRDLLQTRGEAFLKATTA